MASGDDRSTIECDAGEIRALIRYRCELIAAIITVPKFSHAMREEIDAHTTVILNLSRDLADVLEPRPAMDDNLPF